MKMIAAQKKDLRNDIIDCIKNRFCTILQMIGHGIFVFLSISLGVELVFVCVFENNTADLISFASS
jgi:hypothetical protein